MKIAFDAKRAFHNSTGLGNYSRTLIAALEQFYPLHDYYLYTPPFQPDMHFGEKASIRMPKSLFGKVFPSAWRSKGIVRDLERDGIEVFHGLSHELPFGIEKTKIKTVVTIHDVIFKRLPHLYPLVDRKIYDRKWRHALRISDAVICVSQQTKNDVLTFYPDCVGDGKKIYIVPPVLPDLSGGNAAAVPSFIAGKKYLLAVGRVEQRKNLTTVLKALTLMKETERPFLVIAGRKTNYLQVIERFIQESRLQDFVFLLGETDASTLKGLFRQACALVYPSLYEGFGLPITEAQQAGIPVLCSNIDLFREVGGEGVIPASPQDPEAWKSNILRVMDMSSGERERIIRQGYEHVKRFSPEAVARQVMDVYMQLRRK